MIAELGVNKFFLKKCSLTYPVHFCVGLSQLFNCYSMQSKWLLWKLYVVCVTFNSKGIIMTSEWLYSIIW